jgi:4-hydroxy-3-methylbut-2-en-1-yl diphosphate synthase IspG/GcpE
MIFSYELETQLLAGLIKYPGEYCKIAAVISDKDFYSESNKINKTIFLILKQALENAETINEVIISQRVKDLGISFEENINPSDYIESLAVKKIGADSVLATAKELKKFTIRRQIYERCVSVGKKMRGLSSAVPYQEIIDIVDKVKSATQNIVKPITVSILGCVVNGIGEAQHTNIGITGAGSGQHLVYINGKPDHKIPAGSDIADHIIKLINNII